MRVSVGRGREENERKVLRERVKPSRRRLLAEQRVAVVVLGCARRSMPCGICHTARGSQVICMIGHIQ